MSHRTPRPRRAAVVSLCALVAIAATAVVSARAGPDIDVPPEPDQFQVIVGSGELGHGVTLAIEDNGAWRLVGTPPRLIRRPGAGELVGGRVHSPSGAPDLWFQEGDVPTFPGALTTFVEWSYDGGYPDGDVGPSPSDGAATGTSWVKVIADADGVVSWAQCTFDFGLVLSAGQVDGDPQPLLVSIPLYVTRAGGGDFPLDFALLAAARTLANCNPTPTGSFAQPAGGAGSRALDAAGGLVYLADGPAGLQIIDVRFPGSFTRLSTQPTPSAAQDVALLDNVAYVATEGSGLQVVDVSDPSFPAVVATRPLMPFGEDVRGTAVSGTLVCATLSMEIGTRHELWILDGAAPANPILVGWVGLPAAGRVAIAGSYVYVAAGAAGLLVADISDPAQPLLAATLATSSDARDVAAADGIVYVADGAGGLCVVDARDPRAPVAVETLRMPLGSAATGVALAVDVLYVTYSSATTGHGLVVYDIATRLAPSPIGSLDLESSPADVAVARDVALVASREGGLQTIDVRACDLIPTIEFVQRKGLLVDKPGVFRDKAVFVGKWDFLPRAKDGVLEAGTEPVLLGIGSPAADAAFEIPLPAPGQGNGWKTTRMGFVFKTPRGVGPRIRLTLNIRRRKLSLDVRGIDLPEYHSPFGLTLRFGADLFAGSTSWRPGRKPGRYSLR